MDRMKPTDNSPDDAISIPRLRDEISGQVIGPDDDAYDQARTVFYGGFDRRPAVIVRVADPADVARIITVAGESGRELAVRSGGHSVAGYSVSDGGIVLDLSRMKDLQINVAERTAWAETGLTSGEYTEASSAHSLATGFGDTGSVGIGGITLGGGIGYLVRKHGLTIDNLLAAEMVTADGQLLKISAEQHPDLFWAIRGGGGNFGVATRFQFRLHEVDSVVGGLLVLPATPEVLAGFIAAADAAPEELSTIANVMNAPPMPFLPEEYHGKLVVMAMLVYTGDFEAGQNVVAPFRNLATPIADMVKPMRFPEIYPPEEAEYHPIAATRTMFVDAIDSDVAGMILDYLQTSTGSMAVAQLRVLGGAMARVPMEATAFAHRSSKIMATLATLYESLDDKPIHEKWVDGFAAALRQRDSGAYVNFLGDEGPERIHAAYPEPTWARLAEIKHRYDPNNLFRLNQNIPPG